MLREDFKLLFQEDDIPSETAFSTLLDQTPLILSTTAGLPTASVWNLGQVYCVGGVNYRCEETSKGVYEWVNKNAAAAANDYANASNKPKINSVLLSGNKDGDTLKLLSNFSVLADGTTALALTSLLATEDGGDTSVSVKRTVQDLYDLFGIANLPKYETYLNPLLTSDGTAVRWEVTHTCKTSKVIIQLYSVSGGILQTTSGLTALVISNKSTNLVVIEWNTASNVAANSYYVVLIG
jgi:hypothetical protein